MWRASGCGQPMLVVVLAGVPVRQQGSKKGLYAMGKKTTIVSMILVIAGIAGAG